MREEILIVEDDTSLAETITLHLNDQGYATEHVADGLGAVRHVFKQLGIELKNQEQAGQCRCRE